MTHSCDVNQLLLSWDFKQGGYLANTTECWSQEGGVKAGTLEIDTIKWWGKCPRILFSVSVQNDNFLVVYKMLNLATMLQL